MDSAQPQPQQQQQQNNKNEENAIAVGRMVQVASRTWPGINKPGGVARVLDVHTNANNAAGKATFVTVQYVVSRSTEKRVPIDYVALAPEYETTETTTTTTSGGIRIANAKARPSSLRDRSRLLGRCKRCGSLRTDCGSCDWATEEQLAVQVQVIATTNNNNNNNNNNKTTKKSKARLKRILEHSSSSSSSSSDEDALLHELVQVQRRRYRKYLKTKSHWQWSDDDDSDDDDSDTNNVQQQQNSKQKSKRNVLEFSSESSSSSSENDAPATLPLRPSHRSVLETLAAPTSRKTTRRRTKQPKVSLQLVHRPRTSMRVPNRPSAIQPSAVTENNHPQTPPPKHAAMNVDGSDIGIADESSPDGSNRHTPPARNHRLDDDDSPQNNSPTDFGMVVDDENSSPEASRRPRHSNDNTSRKTDTDTPERYGLDRVDDSQQDATLALSQFIQPEGDEVAYNLPQDTLDRTQSLPYHELPGFFDRMATQLQDDGLPDMQLRVAILQHDLRDLLPKRQTFHDDEAAPLVYKKLQELAKTCQETWLELRHDLIRDGTDQCLVAIRRLSADRLYRKIKKKLTPEQRKQCRGSGILEVRNLRMDSLEEAVEEVVHKLKRIMDAVEKELGDRGDPVNNQDSDNEFVDDEDASNSGDFYETQDLIPMNLGHGEDEDLEADERPLAAFHPHMHASRVRTNVTTQRSKNMVRGDTKAKRKRPCSSTQSTIELVDDLNDSIGHAASRDQRRRKEGSTTDAAATGIRRQRKDRDPAPMSNSAGADTALKRQEEEIPHDEGDAEGNDKGYPLRSQDIAGDDDGETEAPTFNLFEEAEEDRTNVLRARNNVPVRERHRTNPQSVSIWEPSQRQSSRQDRMPISQRMQAFLDANSSNAPTLPSSPGEDQADNLKPRKERRKRRRQHLGLAEEDGSRQSHGPREPSDRRRHVNSHSSLVEDRNASIDDPIPSQDSVFLVSAEKLFHQLGNTSNPEPMPVITLQDKNMSTLCEELKHIYPNSPTRCQAVLDAIRSHLKHGPIDTSSGASAFLNTAVSLLQTHGLMTLQELITTKSAILSLHIRLITEGLYVLELGLDVTLRTSDGLIFDMFSSNRDHFVNSLVLQLVDSAYSVIHPEAWALQMVNRARILEVLSPLRDALAKVTCLTESVSRCIVQDLECQQWRRGQGAGNHAFVSSVDPKQWKSYLSTGIKRESAQRTRFSAFNKSLPRVEVNAMWTLFAFVGATESITDDKYFTRWQVLSKIFTSGVLVGVSTNEAITKLPPSESQLLECKKEIGYLTALLERGALDALPGTDSVVFNLILRSLALQSDDYDGNEESRVACFPSIRNMKTEKKRVGYLWKASCPSCFASGDAVRVESVSLTDAMQSSVDRDDVSRIHDTVLPSSFILEQCLRLLLSWVQRVPTKKVRQSRLSKSINTFIKSLLQQSTETEESGKEVRAPTISANSFEAMFSVGPPTESGKASDRKGLFFKEASAYFKIMSFLAVSHGQMNGDSSRLAPLDKDLTLQVWDIMADAALKERRSSIVGGPGNPVQSKHDPFALFTVAKVMTFLTFIQVGVSPWNLSSGTAISKLSFDVSRQGNIEEDALVFPVSCLFSCLDCLCGLDNASDVMARLYSNVASIYTNLCALLTSEAIEIRPAICFLGRSSPSIFGRTLIKCFQTHTTVNTGSPCDHILMRSFLSALRGIFSLQGKVNRSRTSTSNHAEATPYIPAQENTHSDQAAESENLFGELGDDVFACLDLGAIESTASATTKEDNQMLSELVKCLSRSLEMSKPSERFAITQSYGITPTPCEWKMTVQGRSIVAKQIDKISDCIVAIIAAGVGLDPAARDSIRRLLAPPTLVRAGDDDGDAQHFRLIAKCLSSELCCLAETHDTCRSIVAANGEEILFNWVETLLDSSRLEIFPSCNLERIRENGGEPAEQHAMTLFHLFNDQDRARNQPTLGGIFAGIQRKRRQNGDDFWTFSKSFGQSLTRIDGANCTNIDLVRGLGDILKEEDSDLPSKPGSSLSFISVETEALNAFKQLRGITSVSAKHFHNSRFGFGRIASVLIATILTQTLRITQSLQYHDRTCDAENENDRKDFRRAKLVELLSCFSELTVATLSWIVRESRHDESGPWQFLLSQIRDRFFCPILQQQKVDLTVVLQQIVLAARSLLAGTSRQNNAVSGSPERSRYLEGIFGIVIRRSRQLLVHFSRCLDSAQPLGLLNSLVAAPFRPDVANDNEDLIARTIGTSFQRRPLVDRQLETRTQLQKAIDDYFSFLEQTAPWTPADDASMEKVKHHALKNLLVPRLNHVKTDLSTKRRAIKLVGYILQRDLSQYLTPSFSAPDIDIFISLARGVTSTLRAAIEAKSVDEDLIAALLICSKSLASTQIASEDGSGISLIQWSRVNSNPSKEEMLELSHTQLKATYFWAILRWLNDVAKLVADPTEAGQARLLESRQKSKERRCHKNSAVDEDDTNASLLRDDGIYYEAQLGRLEKVLFPERRENNPNIHNAYAKATTMSDGDNDLIESWSPSGVVRRRAKEFMAEVISISYNVAV